MEDELSTKELRHVFCELGFVTGSDGLIPLLQRTRKAADVSDVTVLIEGETGTGKQVLANAIRLLDNKRRSFPFVTVHCSTISEALAESELFGHQRGAFSGAVAHRKGLFQAAHRGTLFLDDVNDLAPPLQAKLLDVLQRGMLRPVGSDAEISVDVRVIAAANRPLDQAVREGRFRADLYHRLNVVRLSLPPLRARRAELATLMLAFTQRHCSVYGPIVGIEPELLRMLEFQPLPGNVRELENAVQRMLFLKTEGSTLNLDDWIRQQGPDAMRDGTELLAESASAVWQTISSCGVGYDQALMEIEKRVLQAAVAMPGSTRRGIAQQLNISERALYYKMRVHGMTANRFE